MSRMSEMPGRVMDSISERLGVNGTIHITIIPRVENISDRSEYDVEYHYSHSAKIRYEGKWTVDSRKLDDLASELQKLRHRTSTLVATAPTSKEDFHEETLGVIDACKFKLLESGVIVNCLERNEREGSENIEGLEGTPAPESWGLSGESTWFLYKESDWSVTVFDPDWSPCGI